MTTNSSAEFGTVRIQGVGEMPSCPVHALVPGDRVMWNGGAVDVVVDVEYTPSGKSADLTLRREGTGEETQRRMRTARLVAIANIDEIRTRSESIPASPEADEKPSEGTPGTEAPADAESASETSSVASERAPRRRRTRDIALVVSDGDGEHTITARQRRFLMDLTATPQFVEGASACWVDVLIDELQSMGSAFDNGMRVGAMISTLREKGMISVWEEGREDPSTGRVRRVKAMWFTGLGAEVIRAINRSED